MDATTAYPITSPSQDSPRPSTDSAPHRNGTAQDENSWRRRMHKRAGSRDNQDMEVLLLNEKVESLKRELEAERRLRSDEIKNIQRSLQRVYHDCANLASRDAEQLIDLDNKVETLSQRYRADHSELVTLRKRLDMMESLATTLRTLVDSNEHNRQSRQSQPQEQQYYHDSPQEQRNSMPEELNVPNQPRPVSGVNSPWIAQIIWVLSASRPNVSEVDSVAYLKLQSRSTRNKVFFTADTSLSFFLGIEGSFPHIIRRRAWMPLASHKTSESDEVARITLDKLPARMRDDRLWTRAWLEEHCVTYDSAGKPHIYIALQDEDLTLADLDGVAAAGTNKMAERGAPSRIDSGHNPQPAQTTTATPMFASNRSSLRSHTPKPADPPTITTTNPTPIKTGPYQPHHYFQSAPTTARVSIDTPSHTYASTPFTSTGLTTPSNPNALHTTSNQYNSAAHPALRGKARSHSLQLSALPQYPLPHGPRHGPLSPQEEALLAHHPQPGLQPIPAGGTDEAASSIAPSDIRRNRSLGKAERLLGRARNNVVEERTQQQRPMTAGEVIGNRMRRGNSGGAVLQQVSSYGAQSWRSSRDGGPNGDEGGMTDVFDTPPRPASANALDAYGYQTQARPPLSQQQSRTAVPVMEQKGEQGRKVPRKKKSFGRLVDRLTGRSRNSINAGDKGRR